MYKKIRKLVKRIIIVSLNLVYKIKPEVSLKIVFYLRQGHKFLKILEHIMKKSTG